MAVGLYNRQLFRFFYFIILSLTNCSLFCQTFCIIFIDLTHIYFRKYWMIFSQTAQNKNPEFLSFLSICFSTVGKNCIFGILSVSSKAFIFCVRTWTQNSSRKCDFPKKLELSNLYHFTYFTKFIKYYTD